MKKILTAILAAILFTGTDAYAEDLAASKALILEAAKETAQEIRANSGGKKPTQEEIGKKLMEKLRARKDDFKKAYETVWTPTARTKPKNANAISEKPTLTKPCNNWNNKCWTRTNGTKSKNEWAPRKSKTKKPAVLKAAPLNNVCRRIPCTPL